MLKNKCSFWLREGTIPYRFSICIYLYFPMFTWVALLHYIGRFRCTSAVAQKPSSVLHKEILIKHFTDSGGHFFCFHGKSNHNEGKKTKCIWASSKGQRSQRLSLKYFSKAEMIKPYVYFKKFWITMEDHKH